MENNEIENNDPRAIYLKELGKAIGNITAQGDKTRWQDQNLIAQRMIDDIHKKAMEVIVTLNSPINNPK